jgi:hypothetical protein
MTQSDHFSSLWFRAVVVLVVLGIAQSVASAAQTSGRGVAPRLPGDSASWINAGPFTNEMLAGKAAMFWYFEET